MITQIKALVIIYIYLTSHAGDYVLGSLEQQQRYNEKDLYHLLRRQNSISPLQKGIGVSSKSSEQGGCIIKLSSKHFLVGDDLASLGHQVILDSDGALTNTGQDDTAHTALENIQNTRVNVVKSDTGGGKVS